MAVTVVHTCTCTCMYLPYNSSPTSTLHISQANNFGNKHHKTLQMMACTLLLPQQQTVASDDGVTAKNVHTAHHPEAYPFGMHTLD